MSSLESAIQSLLSRLETVTARLEKVEHQIASGASVSSSPAGSSSSSGGADDSASSAAVVQYGDLISRFVNEYVALSGKIDPMLGQQAQLVLQAAEAQKRFIAIAAHSKKPADSALPALVKPTADLMQQIVEIRDKNRTSKLFNNLSAVSEGIGALGWVLVSPTPGPHVGDMRGGSEFYSNRVLKDFKGKDETQVAWVAAYNGFLKELQNYIKQFHTTGLTWNPSGGDAASAAAAGPAKKAGGPPPPPAAPLAPPPGAPAKGGAPAADMGGVFASLNQGEGVTSGLKKVTADMKSKNFKDKSSVVPADAVKQKSTGKAETKQAKKGPAKFALEGNKWVVENQVGNRDIVIADTEPKQVVYIFGCENSTIQIKGKVNAITIDSCKRTAVVFEHAIATCEMVNGTSVEVQVTGRVPAIAMDKMSGVQLYLSKESIHAEIVTAKSSEMNILIPGAKEGDDLIEIPVPEQYKTVVKDGRLVTEAVQHSG